MSVRPVVLAVDDDPAVLDLAALILEDHYDVITAPDARRALAIIDASDRRIDLLFTDVVMPELNGFALARLAKERLPGLRVIYTTGYVKVADSEREVLHGPVLPKPYRASDLLREVERLLLPT
jgi:DNA-binding NtrC family response regulator